MAWAAEGRAADRARRALRLQRLDVSEREDPFAAIIRCTADTAKADKRTKSKWSRAMRCAAGYKPDSEPLDQFGRRKGGIKCLCCSVLSVAGPWCEVAGTFGQVRIDRWRSILVVFMRFRRRLVQCAEPVKINRIS
jgi:hypothetical protein